MLPFKDCNFFQNVVYKYYVNIKYVHGIFDENNLVPGLRFHSQVEDDGLYLGKNLHDRPEIIFFFIQCLVLKNSSIESYFIILLTGSSIPIHSPAE